MEAASLGQEEFSPFVTLHSLKLPSSDARFYIFVFKTILKKHVIDYPVI